MTPLEVLYGVRMLLDDTKDWYFSNILWAINKAQIELLQKYYQAQDEYALRPFYKFDLDLQDNSVICEASIITGLRTIEPARVMYPRACYIYITDHLTRTNPIPNTHIRAKYLDPANYFQLPPEANVPFDLTASVSTVYPKNAVYTIITDPVEQRNSRIRFPQQASNQRAMLYYIEYPPNFDIQWDDMGNITSITGLTFDKLYHAEIVGRAAEILNTQDVGEIDRGDFFNVYTGDKKLTLQDVFEIMGNKGG